MILQSFLTERVVLITVDGCLETLFYAFFLKNSIAIKMNPGLTLATINHVLIEIILELSSDWLSYLICGDKSFIGLLDNVIRP